MKVSERHFEPNRSKPFTRLTDDAVFESPGGYGTIHTTTVYLLRRPSENREWIFAVIEGGSKLQFRHPLTLKLRHVSLPTHFDYSTLAVSHHTSSSSFDKLLVVPNPNSPNSTPNYEDSALFALCDGGKLRARPHSRVAWVCLGHDDYCDDEDRDKCRFDDVVVYDGKVQALDRDGGLHLIDNQVESGVISLGQTLLYRPSSWYAFKWRKRVVVDGEKRMYMVHRTEKCFLKVCKRITQGVMFDWEEVTGFDGNKVLFMSRDYYFFCRASKFPGKKYRNCIVFLEVAFPRYGYNCWKFSSFFKQSRSCEGIIGVFRVGDKTLGRVGENEEFPKIHWSPISRKPPELKFRSLEAYVASRNLCGIKASQVSPSQSSSDCHTESERECDGDEGLDSLSRDEKNGEGQSNLKETNSKDDEQKEMEFDFDYQDDEEVESDSGCRDHSEETMQYDLESQEKEDGKMHLSANTDGGPSLQEDTKISRGHQSQRPLSRKFTLKTDESAFTHRRNYVYPTTVYLLRPLRSLTSNPTIIASQTTADDYKDVSFCHPLIPKLQSWKLSRNINIARLHPSILAVSYHFHKSCPVDKLLVVPTPPLSYSSYSGGSVDVSNCTLLALYGGGQLQGCPRMPRCSRTMRCRPTSVESPPSWVKLGNKFDDIIVFRDKIYAVDREGATLLINNYKTVGRISMGKTLTYVPGSGSRRIGWRKRLVVDGTKLYVVVRTAEKSFIVFLLECGQSKRCFWEKVTRFEGDKVLFVARDYYFFRRPSKKFPGREFENCIVFSEAAFPEYGNDCWEFTQSDSRQLREDDTAVFRLANRVFSREGEEPGFPKIDWSPPAWIFIAAEFLSFSSTESERGSDKDEGLDSDTMDENEREVQSDLKDSNNEDVELESNSGSQESQDQEEEAVELDSGSPDQDGKKMQYDYNSREKEDEEMHLNANTEGVASLQENSKISGGQQSQTPPSRKFTLTSDKPDFTHRWTYVYPTTVDLLRPPRSLTSYSPCIIASETAAEGYRCVSFRHPLTPTPQSWNLSRNFEISKLRPSTLAVSYQFHKSCPVDALLVVPTPRPSYSNGRIYVGNCIFLALYGGGELLGCPLAPPAPPTPQYSRSRFKATFERTSLVATSSWVELGNEFDDIVVFQDKIYAVDRQGTTLLINNDTTARKISIGETLTFVPKSGSKRFRWRKRLVVDGATLYVVVRTAEKSFQVFRLKWGQSKRAKKYPAKSYFWDDVTGFDGNKVLFMSRDYYFFRRPSKTFPGREYANCIVFSEAAFPQYGIDCWEFTKSDLKLGEDDIAVFRLDDKAFAREGENPCFPKIDWSPPAWIYVAAECSSYPFIQSERESDEDKSLSSDSKDEKNGEVRSDLKDSDSKDGEVHEVMECDSGSEDPGEEKMQCDSNGEERRDAEMHLNGNTQTPLSAAENEITRTLSSNGASGAIEEETRKNIVELVRTSSASKSNTSEYTTIKFEGFDIRSDLVSTLQKIWQKHENVVEKCIIRNSEIIARALESLAKMVQTLEDNPAHSLSDSQSDYLASTLADLRCICFKVDWLVPYVEKAVKLHESKSSLESLSNLTQLSSQVKERKAKLLGELSKLSEEENKLKEEVEKVSKTIPFSGQLNFDEPIGAGLT